ncbi:hypothetical protein EMCRGX_G011435, partial [Ephydatia muelleri]
SWIQLFIHCVQRIAQLCLSGKVPIESQGWGTSAPPSYEPPQYPSSQSQSGFQPGYPYSQPGLQPPAHTTPAQPIPGYGQYGYAGFQPTSPPQYPMGQPFQPQQNTNVVVISAQPSAATTTVVHRPTGDHYMSLSLVMTIICVMCGGWVSLMCTIPAIMLASMAKNDDAAGNAAAAKTKGNIALALNIIAVLFHIMLIIAIITPFAVIISSYSNYYYNYNYSYTYYCRYCSYLSYYYCSYSYGYSSSYSSYIYTYYSCS